MHILQLQGANFGFNSRPCVRGDGSVVFNTSSGRWFQFTPLREGRPDFCLVAFLYVRFQFTPLREGRRLIYHDCFVFEVSIHAPA